MCERERPSRKPQKAAAIVMPRHDFKSRGQTDSVTSAWFVWQQGDRRQQIDIVTKDERDELKAQAT